MIRRIAQAGGVRMDVVDSVSRATAKRTTSGATATLLCAAALLLPAGHARSADESPDGQIDAKSFQCITKMTPVRHFYVDNLRGDLEATLAAANSSTGAVYPPGSVVQLVPGE